MWPARVVVRRLSVLLDFVAVGPGQRLLPFQRAWVSARLPG
jgi:hypothetical protein